VTAPPATPAPAAARPADSESGIASYYDDPNGGCAHKTLPFGTVVHITASNGRTASCVVDDRGPFGPGRILDLDTAIFARLAPLSAGLVTVTATW
jgi:rare lipoprotein A